MRFRKGLSTVVFAMIASLIIGAGTVWGLDCNKAAFEALGLTDETFGSPVIFTSANLVAADATTPELCDVRGSMFPTVGFAVKLPTAKWNNRFQMMGCGGAAGSISETTLLNYVRKGFAIAGTDTGHTGSSTDWSFGYNPPDNSNPYADQKIADYAYRSAHETVVLGKKLVKAFYGMDPSFSYYNGSSCGGRLGMMNAQRYPDDFDGLVIGMPPLNMLTRVWDIWNEWVQEGDARVPISKLNMLANAVYSICDSLDGLVDGFIDDPRNCTLAWIPMRDEKPNGFRVQNS